MRPIAAGTTPSVDPRSVRVQAPEAESDSLTGGAPAGWRWAILWVFAVVGLLVSQALNFTVFAQSLNPDLTSGDLTAAVALDTLDNWDTLHLVRTAFVILSAVATTALVATGLAKAEATS